jgi:hypothetical protein
VGRRAGAQATMLISLERVKEQATSENLLRLILNSVKLKSGMYGRNLVHKLMSFEVGEKLHVLLVVAACKT